MVFMLVVISSSPPLLYSLDLPRSRMYLVPCTFHHRITGIYRSSFKWGSFVPRCFPQKKNSRPLKVVTAIGPADRAPFVQGIQYPTHR